MALIADDIDRRFTHHPPGPGTLPIHGALRHAFRRLAELVADQGPSRETSLAVTALEEALMWANAHVARNLDPDTGDMRPAP